MFDIVIVEWAIPDAGAASVKEWQTKDFHPPSLDTYKITAAGRLMFERIHYEDRSDPSLPKDTFESLAGSMTPVHDAWEDTNYHGILNFYGDADPGELPDVSPGTSGEDPDHAEETEWFEYNAKFTDGKLVALERVERDWR